MKVAYQTSVSIKNITLNLVQADARLQIAPVQDTLLPDAIKQANMDLEQQIAQQARLYPRKRFANRFYSAHFSNYDEDSHEPTDGCYLIVTVEGDWIIDV